MKLVYPRPEGDQPSVSEKCPLCLAPAGFPCSSQCPWSLWASNDRRVEWDLEADSAVDGLRQMVAALDLIAQGNGDHEVKINARMAWGLLAEFEDAQTSWLQVADRNAAEILRLSHLILGAARDNDFCIACECHPSHGHASDCPVLWADGYPREGEQ